MEFDANRFAGRFRNTVDWMLEDKHGVEIRDDLALCKARKNELKTRPDSIEMLRFLVLLKVTNSWYRRQPVNFDTDFNSFTAKYGENFRTPRAADELAALVEKHMLLTPKGKGREWIPRLLSDFPTLRDLTEDLYVRRTRGKTSEVVGEKGADDYLRNFGYWDRIPIDIHEKRFLIRSGIFHAFSVSAKQDPLEPGALQHALSRFCSLCLAGKIVEGMDLASAPGIVDIFIWSYCAERRYNICGSTPRCDDCGLRNACLFGVTNMENALPPEPSSTVADHVEYSMRTKGKGRGNSRKNRKEKDMAGRFDKYQKAGDLASLKWVEEAIQFSKQNGLANESNMILEMGWPPNWKRERGQTQHETQGFMFKKAIRGNYMKMWQWYGKRGCPGETSSKLDTLWRANVKSMTLRKWLTHYLGTPEGKAWQQKYHPGWLP